MTPNKKYDVIIVGGSYAGLSAAMSLGRARLQVLVIDNGLPCNRQTPHSHNFLTNDGKTPAEIAAIARLQVSNYSTVQFFDSSATGCYAITTGFQVQVQTGEAFEATKIIFATGIRDVLPSIPGFADCWGISVLHCPFCHGYEVRDQPTGIFANGDVAFDMARLIHNWTSTLTVFTNGPSTFTTDQFDMLRARGIEINEKEVLALAHERGKLTAIQFVDGDQLLLPVLYARVLFEQHCNLPAELGCELTPEGYLLTNAMHETTVKNCYAIGDNASPMRTVANAVATGNAAGIRISRELISDSL